MNDFLDSFGDTSGVPILFLTIFSFFIAIFHTILLKQLFKLKFKNWLLFVVYPLSIVALGSLHKSLGIIIMITLFASTFIIVIIGFIVSGIHSKRKADQEKQRFRKKHNIEKPKFSWLKMLKGLLGSILFTASFFMFGPITFIFIIFVLPFIKNIFSPSNRKKLLNYQAILPTSKIRSLAMGLAEIEGKLIMQEPLISPIKSKTCIGFSYEIEDIDRDKEGRESYSTIFYEQKCNPFYVEDDTGKIEVNPTNLEYVWMPVDEQYRSGGRRYTQCLILQGQETLLIGKAGLKENNTPVFEKDDIKNVFAIAPSNRITGYNTNKPLFDSARLYFGVFAFFTAMILITPIHLESNRIVVKKPDFIKKTESFFSNKKENENIPENNLPLQDNDEVEMEFLDEIEINASPKNTDKND